MITFQCESFADVLPELMPLLPVHFEELALDKDKAPLDPQYDKYVLREQMGELEFITVRECGDIIGYFIGFVAPGMHYKSTLTCIMDIFYIVPEKRGSDMGFRMFEFVRNRLKSRGVKRWFNGSKCHLDASWLFERLGMVKVETYYSEWIGD